MIYTELTKKAINICFEAHKEQKDLGKMPYVHHPFHLAEQMTDEATIVTALLHDVVEDTIMTEEEITEVFGKEVALLVDGVTKLGQLSYSSDKLEVQAENLRKMFLAMAKDIRVILIKLADRLHNMRTLQFMREEKQMEKAKETLDIYAPLAQRLGISKLKVEIVGTAQPNLQTRMKIRPNPWQTWSQFLYRLSALLDMQNTAFILPIISRK